MGWALEGRQRNSGVHGCMAFDLGAKPCLRNYLNSHSCLIVRICESFDRRRAGGNAVYTSSTKKDQCWSMCRPTCVCSNMFRLTYLPHFHLAGLRGRPRNNCCRRTSTCNFKMPSPPFRGMQVFGCQSGKAASCPTHVFQKNHKG